MKKRVVLSLLITIILLAAINKSRLVFEPISVNFEIVFLLIFFIFLFIPMLHIEKNDISHRENRTLAKLPPIIGKNGRLNYKFPKQFDVWFNDRFNLRKSFIEAYNAKLILNKNWKTKDVIKGKDNWLFLGRMESINSYTNQNLFNNEQMEEFANYLSEIDETLYKVPDINNNFMCKNLIKNSDKTIGCYNKNQNVNLLVYRDSFTISLIPYYMESFKNAKYIW